jgi:peptidyl-dipeptidase A
LKEASGGDISTRAMMEYFKPLMSWLEEQNKGRQIGCAKKAVLSQFGISE